MRTAACRWIRDAQAVTSRSESTLEDWERILGARLTFSASRAGGVPIVVRRYRLAEDGEAELPSIADHAIMLLVGRPAHVECRVDDHRGISRPGACAVLPGGATAACRWIGAPTVVHVYLSAAWLDGILREEGLDPHHVKVVARSGCHDPFLWIFGTGLLRRMQSAAPIERMMLDGAALGLACHLLRAHSTLAGAGMLSDTERLRVSDFIDEAIAAEFGLDDLARATGTSRLALARSFASADTGRLHNFLNGRRIEQARQLFLQSPMTIEEIAHAAGFMNVAALDTALYFAVGCSAGEYRMNSG